MKPKAIIVGAGIAGLSSAIALRLADYDVSVYEQAPAIAPMGAALSLWANAMAALQWLGVADRIVAEAAPIRHIAACTRTGRPMTSIDLDSPYGHKLPTPYLPTRSLVQAALLGELNDSPLRPGMKLASVSQTSNEATAFFEDGTQASADLLIMADGIWSATACALIGNSPKHQGYGGVLALSDPVSGLVAAGSGTEYSVPGERYGLFDLGSDRAYWFCMLAEGGPEQSHGLDRDQIEARLAGWPSPLMTAVQATPPDRLIPYSIQARAAPRKLGAGRIICVGDAAHAMQPNFGQGGCQALEDAMALGIAAQMREANEILPLFERLRLKRIAMFVNGSRAAALISQSNSWLATMARVAASAVPDALISMRLTSMHCLPDYQTLAARLRN